MSWNRHTHICTPAHPNTHPTKKMNTHSSPKNTERYRHPDRQTQTKTYTHCQTNTANNTHPNTDTSTPPRRTHSIYVHTNLFTPPNLFSTPCPPVLCHRPPAIYEPALHDTVHMVVNISRTLFANYC